MIRMNITMPDDLAAALKRVPNKSRFIADALEEKIQRERSKKQRALLAEAYTASAEEDRALAQDWDAAVADGSGAV